MSQAELICVECNSRPAVVCSECFQEKVDMLMAEIRTLQGKVMTKETERSLLSLIVRNIKK